MKYKVRFHLGQGQNYRHWQVTSPDGTREFYDPEEYIIRMENARLHNNCKVAEQIYKGRNKTVCAWIVCENVVVKSLLSYLFSESPSSAGKPELIYNPRKNPHWLENGENVDFKRYSRLLTDECGVFVEVE
tara:strand:- start:2248 stop:2640 length:393 start_codon:yes stop_codon:yes gene_type:complete